MQSPPKVIGDVWHCMMLGTGEDGFDDEDKDWKGISDAVFAKNDSFSKIPTTKLQGVGTRNKNPWGMDVITGAVSNRPKVLSMVVGTITGKGEKENIEYYMHKLRTADKRPSRLILNGHSRGASACIELARAIYLEFGDEIKIAMDINDPVPGPFLHTRSKMVIPPNVDSLVITYAGAENRTLYTPQDLKEIIFNPEKTTVTTVILPGINHIFDAGKGQNAEPTEYKCYFAAAEISQGLWNAVSGIEIDLTAVKELNCEDFLNGKKAFRGTRKDLQFIMASDPKKNKGLSTDLENYHRVLKKTAYKCGADKVKVPDGEDRYRGMTEAIKFMGTDTLQERKKILAMMYNTGKNNIKNMTLKKIGTILQIPNTDLNGKQQIKHTVTVMHKGVSQKTKEIAVNTVVKNVGSHIEMDVNYRPNDIQKLGNKELLFIAISLVENLRKDCDNLTPVTPINIEGNWNPDLASMVQTYCEIKKYACNNNMLAKKENGFEVNKVREMMGKYWESLPVFPEKSTAVIAEQSTLKMLKKLVPSDSDRRLVKPKQLELAKPINPVDSKKSYPDTTPQIKNPKQDFKKTHNNSRNLKRSL